MSRLLPILALALALCSCDFVLTRDQPAYEDLDQPQRGAVDRIFARLQAYDARLRSVSAGRYGLGPIAEDRERIDVSLDGLWIFVNLGDDRIHITTWEGLTAVQQERWASWFGDSPAAAASRYRRFFYDYVPLHLAGLQTIFSVQGVAWVYARRGTFSVDRDAERMAVNYLTETERALFNTVRADCRSIRTVFDDRWAGHYDKDYYGDHFRELTDPDDPSGQLWFLCKHLEAAEARRVEYTSSFRAELDVLVELRAAN